MMIKSPWLTLMVDLQADSTSGNRLSRRDLLAAHPEDTNLLTCYGT
jgi:hypothetical protein